MHAVPSHIRRLAMGAGVFLVLAGITLVAGYALLPGSTSNLTGDLLPGVGYCCQARNSGNECIERTRAQCGNGAFHAVANAAEQNLVKRQCDYNSCGVVGFCCVPGQGAGAVGQCRNNQMTKQACTALRGTFFEDGQNACTDSAANRNCRNITNVICCRPNGAVGNRCRLGVAAPVAPPPGPGAGTLEDLVGAMNQNPNSRATIWLQNMAGGRYRLIMVPRTPATLRDVALIALDTSPIFEVRYMPEFGLEGAALPPGAGWLANTAAADVRVGIGTRRPNPLPGGWVDPNPNMLTMENLTEANARAVVQYMDYSDIGEAATYNALNNRLFDILVLQTYNAAGEAVDDAFHMRITTRPPAAATDIQSDLRDGNFREIAGEDIGSHGPDINRHFLVKLKGAVAPTYEQVAAFLRSWTPRSNAVWPELAPLNALNSNVQSTVTASGFGRVGGGFVVYLSPKLPASAADIRQYLAAAPAIDGFELRQNPLPGTLYNGNLAAAELPKFNRFIKPAHPRAAAYNANVRRMARVRTIRRVGVPVIAAGAAGGPDGPDRYDVFVTAENGATHADVNNRIQLDATITNPTFLTEGAVLKRLTEDQVTRMLNRLLRDQVFVQQAGLCGQGEYQTTANDVAGCEQTCGIAYCVHDVVAGQLRRRCIVGPLQPTADFGAERTKTCPYDAAGNLRPNISFITAGAGQPGTPGLHPPYCGNPGVSNVPLARFWGTRAASGDRNDGGFSNPFMCPAVCLGAVQAPRPGGFPGMRPMPPFFPNWGGWDGFQPPLPWFPPDIDINPSSVGVTSRPGGSARSAPGGSAGGSAGSVTGVPCTGPSRCLPPSAAPPLGGIGYQACINTDRPICDDDLQIQPCYRCVATQGSAGSVNASVRASSPGGSAQSTGASAASVGPGSSGSAGSVRVSSRAGSQASTRASSRAGSVGSVRASSRAGSVGSVRASSRAGSAVSSRISAASSRRSSVSSRASSRVGSVASSRAGSASSRQSSVSSRSSRQSSVSSRSSRQSSASSRQSSVSSRSSRQSSVSSRLSSVSSRQSSVSSRSSRQSSASSRASSVSSRSSRQSSVSSRLSSVSSRASSVSSRSSRQSSVSSRQSSVSSRSSRQSSASSRQSSVSSRSSRQSSVSSRLSSVSSRQSSVSSRSSRQSSASSRQSSVSSRSSRQSSVSSRLSSVSSRQSSVSSRSSRQSSVSSRSSSRSFASSRASSASSRLSSVSSRSSMRSSLSSRASSRSSLNPICVQFPERCSSASSRRSSLSSRVSSRSSMRSSLSSRASSRSSLNPICVQFPERCSSSSVRSSATSVRSSSTSSRAISASSRATSASSRRTSASSRSSSFRPVCLDFPELCGSSSSRRSASARSGVSSSAQLCPGNSLCSRIFDSNAQICRNVGISCPAGSALVCAGTCGSSGCGGQCCSCQRLTSSSARSVSQASRSSASSQSSLNPICVQFPERCSSSSSSSIDPFQQCAPSMLCMNILVGPALDQCKKIGVQCPQGATLRCRGTCGEGTCGGDCCTCTFDELLGNYDSCNADAQCSSGLCRNSICAPCSIHSDCGSGRICFARRCVATPVMGNGILEPGEACDDGNLVDGDGCSSRGQLESGEQLCGNGRLDAGEECDLGRDNSDVIPDRCRTDCRNPRMGDGITDRNEQCDDGNLVSGDGCDRFGRIEVNTIAVDLTFNPLTAMSIARAHAPAGQTGPGAILVMVGGAAAGWAWMRRRRRR